MQLTTTRGWLAAATAVATAAVVGISAGSLLADSPPSVPAAVVLDTPGATPDANVTATLPTKDVILPAIASVEPIAEPLTAPGSQRLDDQSLEDDSSPVEPVEGESLEVEPVEDDVVEAADAAEQDDEDDGLDEEIADEGDLDD